MSDQSNLAHWDFISNTTRSILSHNSYSSLKTSCIKFHQPYIVVANIEKNFALGTEKFINFHCLSQYLQSGLGSHPGQTSPYRRSTGETLNRYSLWRQSPGLAKCSQVYQFPRARWAEWESWLRVTRILSVHFLCLYLCVRRYLGNFIPRFVFLCPGFGADVIMSSRNQLCNWKDYSVVSLSLKPSSAQPWWWWR